MYELIALSLLLRGPTHGYIIAGVINDVIGPFAKASNGRIYPLLAKLQEDDYIVVHAETTSPGGRISRVFEITPSGKHRFRALMLDTSGNPREYREVFSFKVAVFDQLDREGRIEVLQHYAEFSRAHVRHLRVEGDDVAQATTYRHSDRDRARMAGMFAHLIGTWQREAAWADELLAGEALHEAEQHG